MYMGTGAVRPFHLPLCGGSARWNAASGGRGFAGFGSRVLFLTAGGLLGRLCFFDGGIQFGIGGVLGGINAEAGSGGYQIGANGADFIQLAGDRSGIGILDGIGSGGIQCTNGGQIGLTLGFLILGGLFILQLLLLGNELIVGHALKGVFIHAFAQFGRQRLDITDERCALGGLLGELGLNGLQLIEGLALQLAFRNRTT